MGSLIDFDNSFDAAGTGDDRTPTCNHDTILVVALRGAGNQSLLVGTIASTIGRLRLPVHNRRTPFEECHDNLRPMRARSTIVLMSLIHQLADRDTSQTLHEGIGTMVSPCPPINMAETSSTLTPNSCAMNVRNLAVSRTPALSLTDDWKASPA
jgi:hypothetical protein